MYGDFGHFEFELKKAPIAYIGIGYKNILVNLDDAPKVERTYRSGDLCAS